MKSITLGHHTKPPDPGVTLPPLLPGPIAGRGIMETPANQKHHSLPIGLNVHTLLSRGGREPLAIATRFPVKARRLRGEDAY
jgi:hypothetical protein